jgi:hypothetical protein
MFAANMRGSIPNPNQVHSLQTMNMVSFPLGSQLDKNAA